MLSNTKLTPEQKIERKEMLAWAEEDGLHFMYDEHRGLTMLIREYENTCHVWTAVCSPDEQKYRRKVGEYYALLRWAYGQDGAVFPTGFFFNYKYV